MHAAAVAWTCAEPLAGCDVLKSGGALGPVLLFVLGVVCRLQLAVLSLCADVVAASHFFVCHDCVMIV